MTSESTQNGPTVVWPSSAHLLDSGIDDRDQVVTMETSDTPIPIVFKVDCPASNNAGTVWTVGIPQDRLGGIYALLYALCKLLESATKGMKLLIRRVDVWGELGTAILQAEGLIGEVSASVQSNFTTVRGPSLKRVRHVENGGSVYPTSLIRFRLPYCGSSSDILLRLQWTIFLAKECLRRLEGDETTRYPSSISSYGLKVAARMSGVKFQMDFRKRIATPVPVGVAINFAQEPAENIIATAPSQHWPKVDGAGKERWRWAQIRGSKGGKRIPVSSPNPLPPTPLDPICSPAPMVARDDVLDSFPVSQPSSVSIKPMFVPVATVPAVVPEPVRSQPPPPKVVTTKKVSAALPSTKADSGDGESHIFVGKNKIDLTVALEQLRRDVEKGRISGGETQPSKKASAPTAAKASQVDMSKIAMPPRSRSRDEHPIDGRDSRAVRQPGWKT